MTTTNELMEKGPSDKAIDASIAVTSLLYFLKYEKEKAIEQLFHNANENYKQEWRNRELYAFWMHLGPRGRAQLTELAIKHYAGTLEC